MSASDQALTIRLDSAETPLLVREQNWLLLSYFNGYRLTLALLACIAGFWHGALAPFGSTDPRLFLIVALLYAATYLIALDTTRRRLGDFETQAAVLAFLDIVALILLMHASGGLASGTGVLLLVSIAGTSFLLGRRLTMFFAALATVGMLLEQAWPYLTGSRAGLPASYSQVGLFGLVLFATAALAQFVADRLRITEALAEQQEVDLRHMARLNEQIVQQLQSGVLVVDQTGRVQLANKTACTYLGCPDGNDGRQLDALAPPLHAQWLAQRQTSSAKRRLFLSPAGYTLLPRFRALGDKGTAMLIFLEDTAILKQQAQQLKMSGLARLTAGIAHEIRNPLGAITHAAQLLLESPDVQNGETRDLASIINDQSRRMNTIVESVLQLGRRDRTHTSRFRLEDWLNETLPALATALNVPKDALSLVIETQQAVCFDTDHLFQIINNLCHNSLKHSPPYSGDPLIKIEAGTEGDRSVLDIIDWGPGIRAGIVDQIFDPFFTTTARGTGLGLYIGRELAEANGGTLEYRPIGTAGCRFRLTFGRLSDCTDTSFTP